jgi:hypothetical protein
MEFGMTENHRKYLLGKFKVVIGRASEFDEWEVLNIRFFHDGFDFNLNDTTEAHATDLLRDQYIMGDSYKEELKDLAKIGLQVFEIVGELHEESWKSWTDCGYEYDANNWFDKTKVQELTGEALEWFKDEQGEQWKEFIGTDVMNE